MNNIRFYNEQEAGENIMYEATPLDSELWGLCQGASSGFTVNTVLAELMKESAGEHDEGLLEELFEYLCHQMSFYDTVYLSFPHLVTLFEKTMEEEDFAWQMALMSHMGICLAADVPYNHNVEDETIDKEVLHNYNVSIQYFCRLTKRFLDKHLEEIRQMDSNERSWLATAVLAILGDREAAFILTICGWDTGEMCCVHCDYYDEEIVLSDKDSREAVTPAESVIGEWDGHSYKDTYLWFSNFLAMIGAEEELEILSFYYGTYTCPECGKKGIVMDMMKRFQEEESAY